MATAKKEGTQLLEALWHDRGETNRGPRPSLSRDALAQKAVAIADAHGLEAVSMERVARELGVTKMALYRYIRSKAELIAMMIEVAVGAVPDLSEADGWRHQLESWARALRAAWQRHPWLPSATMGARVIGPREVDWTEIALAALAETPLSAAQRRQVILTISGYVRTTQGPRAAGTQPWFANVTNGRLDMLLEEQRERYPALLDLKGDHTTGGGDEAWDFGLGCILDGIAAAIDRSSAGVP
jgi:AcrR family transcriptional regulator